MLVDIKKLQEEYMTVAKRDAELVARTDDERDMLIKDADHHMCFILSVLYYYDAELEKVIDQRVQEAVLHAEG